MTTVVLAVIQDTHGRLLCIERPQETTAGGLVGLCGGKVDFGESEKEAVVRETREELGVDVTAHTRLGAWPIPEWGCDVVAWLVEGDTTNITPNPREVSRILWAGPAELRDRVDVLRSTLLVLDALENLTGALPDTH